MKTLPPLVLCWLTLALLPTPLRAADPPKPQPESPGPDGWMSLFTDGSLMGWTAPDPGDWTAKPGGLLLGRGPRSHLFSPNTYTNVEFKAEIRLNHRGNSGIYLRAAYGGGWPRGYEAQVENTSPDPQKTGSLYNLHRVTEQLVADDTWWTQHVIAIGTRIIIRVNDKVVTDFADAQATFKDGHLALQQHDPGSVVEYRNVQVRRLPSDEAAAWKIVRSNLPGLPEKAPAGNN